MKNLLFLLSFLFISGNLFAETTIDPQLKGVWRGTIGKQEVMVCFDDDESSYYYLRYFWGIPIIPSGENEWEERGEASIPENSTGHWKLSSVSNQSLEGDWLDPKGERIFPIRLDRVVTRRDPTIACGSHTAFNAPRVAAQKLTVKESNEKYRVLSALEGQISWIELNDNQPNAAKFNKAMREWFQNQVADYYWCSMKSPTIYFNKVREVKFYAGNWLVLEDTDAETCGDSYSTVYGGIMDMYKTFNLSMGKRIEPWDWIRRSKFEYTALKGQYGHAIPNKLNEIILPNAMWNRNKKT